MNAYSQLLRYIKGLVEQDEYITTVLNRVPDDFDWEKGNVFPIFNISALGGSISSTATVLFNVELTCVDIRMINKENINDKFWDNDNSVDNHNATLASLTAVWTKMSRDFARNNITASDSPTINQIDFEGVNLSDGWSMTFDVEMPIYEVGLC
jgi:hypothetical protein|tara:strand:+ start:278 stop:736 length:459 start_codon:yes stop_codon:yes gene_type:complete